MSQTKSLLVHQNTPQASWEEGEECGGTKRESLALMTRGQIIIRYVSSCARNLWEVAAVAI